MIKNRTTWLRRIGAMVLALALCFGLGAPVLAAENQAGSAWGEAAGATGIASQVQPMVGYTGVSDATWEAAKEAIRVGVRQRQTRINLSAYGLPKDCVSTLYGELVNREAEFYVAHSDFYYWWDNAGKITELELTYYSTAERDPALYEAAIQKALDESIKPGMDAIAAMLALHDWLALHIEYDLTYTRNDAYNGLVNGTTVCQGYTMIYADLLSRVGIESIMTVSRAMDHSWNLVNLNGNWYHVDVTWDDPTKDLEGRVKHTFFLLSDAAMATATNNGVQYHHSWEALRTCSDTTYDTNVFWQGIDTQFSFNDNDQMVYLEWQDRQLYAIRRERQTGQETVLYSMPATWYVQDGSGYYYTNGHATLSYDHDNYYFNTDNEIYCLSPDGTFCQSIFSLNRDGRDIYGIFVEDRMVSISIASDPSGTNLTVETYLITDSGLVPFLDVEPSRYYRNPVGWAYYTGVVKGMDDTHFAPEDICNRAQAVTFLYRAAGSPEVTSDSCPFVDVEPGRYYYKAVLWAVENGIVKGTDDTHFDPDATVTRSQFVTFLYRLAGKPDWASNAGFVDVDSSRYYATAVAWAASNGIVKGTDATHFDPNGNCTRGQVVTFLYRYFG